MKKQLKRRKERRKQAALDWMDEMDGDGKNK
jgi:hypothetical protein